MKNLNKTITKDKARKLTKATSGMCLPNTDHNRKMIAEVMHEHLIKLHKGV